MVKIGIRIEFTVLMLSVPLKTTKKTSTQNITPNNALFIGTSVLIEFICTRFPVVKEFTTQNKEKTAPKIKANFLPQRSEKPSYI